MAWIDYTAVQQALVDLLTANKATFDALVPATLNNLGTHIFMEAMERDMVYNNMPLFNVRMPEENSSIVSIPNEYYTSLTFEVDVIAFHFTKFSDAATLRDQLLGAARDVVRAEANRKFHPSLETSMLGRRTRFGALTPPGGGGHVALATFAVVAEAYVDHL